MIFTAALLMIYFQIQFIETYVKIRNLLMSQSQPSNPGYCTFSSTLNFVEIYLQLSKMFTFYDNRKIQLRWNYVYSNRRGLFPKFVKPLCEMLHKI